MAAPTAETVAKFLGRAGDFDVISLAEQHLPLVTEMVRTVTRGVGFTGDSPNQALATVIVSATARLTNNPEGNVTFSIDDYQTRNTVFEGFSLIERQILNTYRRTAA